MITSVSESGWDIDASDFGRASDQMKGFVDHLDVVMADAANLSLRLARDRAINVYMEEGLFSVKSDPPNPPPGPLKKRTYNLADAVVIIPATPSRSGLIKGSLQVDLRKAIYGRIHELGGMVGAGPYHITAAHIPPRPFLAPAQKDLEGWASDLTNQAMQKVADAYFGEGVEMGAGAGAAAGAEGLEFLVI